MGIRRSVDTREAAVLEVKSVFWTQDGSIWAKDLVLLGSEGDGADFGLDVVSSGHDEAVDAV